MAPQRLLWKGSVSSCGLRSLSRSLRVCLCLSKSLSPSRALFLALALSLSLSLCLSVSLSLSLSLSCSFSRSRSLSLAVSLAVAVALCQCVCVRVCVCKRVYAFVWRACVVVCGVVSVSACVCVTTRLQLGQAQARRHVVVFVRPSFVSCVRANIRRLSVHACVRACVRVRTSSHAPGRMVLCVYVCYVCTCLAATSYAAWAPAKAVMSARM